MSYYLSALVIYNLVCHGLCQRGIMNGVDRCKELCGLISLESMTCTQIVVVLVV